MPEHGMPQNERPYNNPPASKRGWIFAFLPEISIFVFILVMVFAVLINGGPYIYLLWLLPITAVNIKAIRRELARGRDD